MDTKRQPAKRRLWQGTPSSLRTDFSWTLLGNAVYAAGQWMTIVLLAKLTQPELVGQYALGFAIAVPVFMLTSLQLRLVLVSDVHQAIQFEHYLSLRLSCTMSALLVIFVTAEVLGLRGALLWTILMVGLAQAVEAVSEIYYAQLQLLDRMDRIAKSMIVRSVLSATALTVGVCFGSNLLWGLVGVVLARTAVLLGYDIRESRRAVGAQERPFFRKDVLRPRWDSRVLGRLLWSALPLSILAVLVSLNLNVPRYFIEHALGQRALGIFSAIASISAAGSMAVISLGQSAFARLARLYATEDFGGFRGLLGQFLALAATLGVCGIAAASLVGRQILTILFGPAYAEQADLLAWMMAVGCVFYMAQFLGFGLTAAKCYYSQVVLFTLTTLGVAVGCYLLIPRLGLMGAILAMLIATVVQLSGSIAILARATHRRALLCGRNADAVPADVLVQT
jgi:O-antigen/teichoic acid export membrane protein